MANPFAKYQSEQVQQIAPGFVEAYGRAGAAIGQGIAAVGAGVAKGMEVAEQKKLEQAKLQGALNPYIRTEVKNVETSLANGLLVKGEDGKISVAPGQEKNVDPNKIGRAIDLYNMTNGGTKELKADELTAAVSTIQSYDAMEKTAAEKAKAARDAKIAELDYTSKVLGNAATLSEGIAAFAAQKTQLGIAAGMQGDTQGAALAIAEARALNDKAMGVRFDAMRAAGINVDAYLPPAPVAPPVRPAAAAVGSGASTLYTVPADTAFTESLGRFDATLKTGSEPAPSVSVTAPTPATQASTKSYDYRKMEPETAESFTADKFAATPEGWTVQIDGVKYIKQGNKLVSIMPPVGEIGKRTGTKEMFPDIEASSLRAAAPAAAPAASASKAPTARQLLTGQLPSVAETPAQATAAGQPTAASAPVTSRVTTPNAAVAQAEAEIKSLQTAKSVYIEQQRRFKTMASVAGLQPDQVKAFGKMAEDAFKMSLDIDDQITKKMTLISTEKAGVASGRVAETKLGLDVTKAVEDIAPSFGGGWGSKKYWHILEKYPDEPARGLSDIRVGGFQGSKAEVIDILGSRASFIDATMSIENALDERLEKGGVGLFDLLTLNKGDYDAYTKGNIGEKILLASMRKAIVSGGNFSDADRTFVLEAIAAINNLDPRKREEYLKVLNQNMASMVIGLFDRKLNANGVERRLDLLTPEEREQAVPATERAFQQRFGIDDTGKATAPRAALQAIIAEGRKTSGFNASKSAAASALDKFVADAKAEAEAAKANKTK